jgi:transposase-like protein
MDAIHYKVRENGRYVSKAVYTILGLNMKGKKEVLGLYLSESEGANFWLSVLTDLSDAINAIYPDTEVQLCVVHQVRNSLRYVASKNQKMFMVDLKCVFHAIPVTFCDPVASHAGQPVNVVPFAPAGGTKCQQRGCL